MYASVGVNNFAAYENGGIIDPGELDDLETREVQVNLGGLNNSKSDLKNRNLLLVQRYTVGGGAASADSTGTKKVSWDSAELFLISLHLTRIRGHILMVTRNRDFMIQCI